MLSKIEETLEILKDTYKMCAQDNYEKPQEALLTGILNLKTFLENSDNHGKISNTHLQKPNITYDLRHVDKNGNEYYFYPIGEAEFKKQAYEQGKIFVRVFHPDGKIEDTIRKINRIWTSSVLWNINSMYSRYIIDNFGRECHYSKGANLKVYACPLSYRDSIPKSRYD